MSSDRITIVYVADLELFHAEELEVQQQIEASIETLPFFEKIRSVFNVAEIRVTDELLTTARTNCDNDTDQQSSPAFRVRRFSFFPTTRMLRGLRSQDR